MGDMADWKPTVSRHNERKEQIQISTTCSAVVSAKRWTSVNADLRFQCFLSTQRVWVLEIPYEYGVGIDDLKSFDSCLGCVRALSKVISK